MSQRVAKLESLIRAVVAQRLIELLDSDGAGVTVTRVDAAPDMRNATVWMGLWGDEGEQGRVWGQVNLQRTEVQRALGEHMTTKFVPRLHFKRDSGGEYAAEIDRLLRQL